MPSAGLPGGRRGIVPGVLRAVARCGLLMLAGFMLLIALLYFQQDGLIFPGAASRGQPWAVAEPPAGTELVPLQAAGARTVGLFGPALSANGATAADASRRPTLLYFYGNGMCLKDAVPDLERFRRLGVNVFVPEYVGYGMSTGRPSEAACYATAAAAYDHLCLRLDIDPRRIVPAGWSLGGAVAIDLASERPVAGLATFCAFTSMEDMARRLYPAVPAGLLLRHRFASERKIARVTCPILIGHGTEDSAIPFDMAGRLERAAGGPVTRLNVEGAGHNDFFDSGGDQVGRALTRFLNGLP